MTNEYTDPSGNTAQFQAFASRRVEEPAKRPPVAMLIGVAAVVVVLAAVVAYLIMG